MPGALIVVLGDQLDRSSSAFDGFDAARDTVWMAEVAAEATHVWSHKARIALFLAAMRHFRNRLTGEGITVDYRALDARDNRGDFAAEFAAALERHHPDRVILVEPGEHRVEALFREAGQSAGVPLDIRPDRHFLAGDAEFRAFAKGRKTLVMEHFYRRMRRKTGVLMDGDEPAGGAWNYDRENRRSFGPEGPPLHAAPRTFPPDAVTREVLELVARRFPDHPGRLDRFDWPVTPEEARLALDDFIANRLPEFGPTQDALWTGEPWLFHSRLSAAMNLKLLDPRDAIAAAEAAYRRKKAPLASAEGFIRQILGWREYVRGVYRLKMPEYASLNALDAREPLPAFYWTADTEMNCLRETIGQTLEFGFAHHIQRLMITGLHALLLGVEPKRVHEWYLAVYVDAVEWVELPNTIGMSQFADGGLLGTKPYAASGKYIDRMSDYCRSCRFDPGRATGEDACPFTTLYWDFLDRHRERLAGVGRMTMQIRNLERKSEGEMAEIRERARALRSRQDA